MCSRNLRLRLAVLGLLAAAVAVPTYAGSAVVGLVAGSQNATVGGQALLPKTTLFSGDSLQVKDGVAVVAMGQGSRMVFGRETEASFGRETGTVTVLLGRGNVLLYHPEAGVGLRVKVGELSIAPAKGYETLGDVAVLNDTVTVRASEGMLRIEGNGPAMEVAKGKTITLKRVAAAAPAPAPQAQGTAGAASSSISKEVMLGIQIGTAAAGGIGATFAIIARNKASDALMTAREATSEAAVATAAAKAACQAATSPSVPTECQ